MMFGRSQLNPLLNIMLGKYSNRTVTMKILQASITSKMQDLTMST